MRILVTGATGFVGKELIKRLLKHGHEAVVLTRNISKAAIQLGSECQYFHWENTELTPPLEAFDKVDGVMNLMGESISQRWSEDRKKRIYHSRIGGTRKLIEAIAKLSQRPKFFISTSAVGVYGNRGLEEITERSSLGDDFLAHVCKDWESEAKKGEAQGMRVVIIRVGVVLGHGGGALAKMLPIFKLGAGGALGSGKQFMSWIQVKDLTGMYVEAAENAHICGVLNGTAPYPATNAEFSKSLGKILHRPAIAPVPVFALKLMFGEMSSILLDGQKVIPTKFTESGFRYQCPTLEIALKESMN